MTPRAGLLWVAAAVLAGALAYWDYSQSSAESSVREPAPNAEDVEIEVIYEDSE